MASILLLYTASSRWTYNNKSLTNEDVGEQRRWQAEKHDEDVGNRQVHLFFVKHQDSISKKRYIYGFESDIDDIRGKYSINSVIYVYITKRLNIQTNGENVYRLPYVTQ